MGNYTPLGPKDHSTISNTLQEAEEDHFTDCPEAELRIRMAALLLDGIMAVLAISGLQSLCLALQTHLLHLEIPITEETLSILETTKLFLSTHSDMVVGYLFISLRLAFIYFYFVWALAFAGGSPGKLILGLRVIQKRTGQLVSFPIALLREIFKISSIFIAGVGLFFPLFNKQKETLHDRVFETAVKRVHGRL